MKPGFIGLKGCGLVVLAAVLVQFGFPAQSLAASSDAPVTQDQFRAWTDWAKKSISILDQREKKVESQAGKGNAPGGEVDLMATPTSQTTVAPSETGGGAKGPRFETYFDLNLINQPGTYDALAFDNYHSLVFFDIAPSPDITFSFNLLGPSSFPIYYELDYQATKKLTLRAGKIWIPFDDLSQQSPHNIFGGRVGLQQLMPTNTSNNGLTFLPSLWTELGVGARYMLLESSLLQIETDMTITNGFSATSGPSGDPVNQSEGPNFSVYTPAPNSQGAGSNTPHRNKAVDLRAHGLFLNRFGLGISYYTSQWNPDGDPLAGGGHLFLNMVGVDAQAKILGLELRGGVANMHVMFPKAQPTAAALTRKSASPLSSAGNCSCAAVLCS